jgi:hypothetical protein
MYGCVSVLVVEELPGTGIRQSHVCLPGAVSLPVPVRGLFLETRRRGRGRRRTDPSGRGTVVDC